MKKVLIVIDMQNDFIDGPLGTKEAQAIVTKVIHKISDFAGVVFYTRDTHQEDYLATQEGKHLPVEHCMEGTSGWKLQKDIERIRREEESRIFDKKTFGSKELVFDLSAMHEKEGIEEIELIGLCTDICVIANALTIKSFLPEVPIKVDAECCAGVTPESHQNALRAMKMCHIQVIHEEPAQA